MGIINDDVDAFFLQQLQNIHDSHYPDVWQAELERFAGENNLTP
jgi:hypothetical protein